MNKIKSVSDYINKVLEIVNNQKDDFTIVYRGESKIYPTSCQPNIFRKSYLYQNEFFEKNLFEEMKANKITDGKSYLERAIDAQHDEFPSRLLDVSYNSLIALYFAVTPYYHKEEDIYDNNNGVVYVFFMEKFFCPSGDIINKTYDSMINRADGCFLTRPMFQKNHKLIDHIRLNKRIIAQQGAFILFQGDEVSPIPECYYEKIEISSECKADIRNQLKSLFGIYTGSIYPEPTNLVNEISRKSCKINNNEFTYENEINLVLYNLENELQYYEKKIISYSFSNEEDKIWNLIYDFESKIYSYKLSIQDEYEWLAKHEEEKKKNNIIKTKEKYNKLLVNFMKNINNHIKDLGIELSKELKF